MKNHLANLAVTIVGGLTVAILVSFFFETRSTETVEAPSNSISLNYRKASFYNPETVLFDFFSKALAASKEEFKTSDERTAAVLSLSKIKIDEMLGGRAFTTFHDVVLKNESDRRISAITFRHEFDFGAFIYDPDGSGEDFTRVSPGADFNIAYIDPGKEIFINGFSKYIGSTVFENFLVLVGDRKLTSSVDGFDGGVEYFYDQYSYTILFTFVAAGFVVFFLMMFVLDMILLRHFPDAYVRLGGKKLYEDSQLIISTHERLNAIRQESKDQ